MSGSNKNRKNEEAGTIYMQIDDIRKRRPTTDEFTAVIATTSRGGIDFRFYEKIGSDKAAILVGAGSGWDAPGSALYADIAETLPKQDGISVLRVKYRYPSILAEAVLDVLAGVLFLEREGVRRIGIVGHSFGGAVALQAAVLSETVVTVVPLSPQSHGSHVAADLRENVSALFMHGIDDEVLPAQGSAAIHGLVRGRKELVFLSGTRHSLEESSDEVRETIRSWLAKELDHNGGHGGG